MITSGETAKDLAEDEIGAGSRKTGKIDQPEMD